MKEQKLEEQKRNLLTHKNGRGVISIILLTLIISGITSASASIVSLYYYHKNYSLKVIAVDLAGFIESQKESYVKGSVDDKWLSQKRKELTDYLARVPENTIILTSDVVLSDYPADNSIPVIQFNAETERWIITYAE